MRRMIFLTAILVLLTVIHYAAIEWVDTEAKEGADGYALEWREKRGDLYEGLVFKTTGFTLSAPAAKVLESQQSIRIIILSKATGDLGGRDIQ